VAVDGIDGIRSLTALYLSSSARHREEVEAVAQALSVHTAADPALREPVVDAYRLILETHPSMAPKLVHDLIAWQRWDFVEPIRQARADLAADPLAVYALGLYLRLASDGSGRVAGLPSAGAVSAPRAFEPSSEEEAR
jgi:hypothetical protein